MKRLVTFCLFFVCISATHAQITIYLDTISSAGTGWSLNDTDLGGATTGTPNAWLINNAYAGGSFGVVTIPNTSDQPAEITGSPESYYLHMCSAAAQSNGIFNTNFNASSITSTSYFASMNNSVSTVGYAGVYFSFWWLCEGSSPSAVGSVYYRTSTSRPWVEITGTTFAGSSTWAIDSVHLDSFDNKPFLQFAFRFKHTLSGSDPAFAVDQIRLTASTTSIPPPTASYSATDTMACQDSCITFYNTSSGTIDSVRWTTTPAGATIGSPTGDVTTICFPAAGAYSVTLTAYNSGGSNSLTAPIGVHPIPTPVIVQSGSTLSVSGAYTGYQWYTDTTLIGGANDSVYTVTTPGTYAIIVDSAGCRGYDTIIVVGTTHIPMANFTATEYWLTQLSKNTLNITASAPAAQDLTVTVFDATGKLIRKEQWIAGSSSKQINDLYLPEGLYIIRLGNSTTSAVLKWAK